MDSCKQENEIGETLLSKTDVNSMSQVKEMKVDEFARRLKRLIENNVDSKFTFFLGSGCSVSSGIPDAGTLVKTWLPRLKEMKTGTDSDLDAWVAKAYPDYDQAKAALIYGKIIDDLFITPEERQNEVERLTEGKDPALGYQVLAQLMTHEEYGRHCNVALTTNFDDLVADALYLTRRKKPLVVYHDTLTGFVRVTRSRPLVVKLHGDARLEPKNTEQETRDLSDAVKKVLAALLQETGVVFIGYGGNDESIAEVFSQLPQSALPWGIHWIGAKFPNGKMGTFLRERNAVLVNHFDFDELMLIIWSEFKLSHPERGRFENLMGTYSRSLERINLEVFDQKLRAETKPLSAALDKAIVELKDYEKVPLEASKFEVVSPGKADAIYQDGLKQFAGVGELKARYARFLAYYLRDIDKAEKYYEEAVKEDPNNANVILLCAAFLAYSRGDPKESEKFFKRAMDLAPDNAIIMTRYAGFLAIFKKDYENAEVYFRKALMKVPEEPFVITRYAGVLLMQGHSAGLALVKRAQTILKEGRWPEDEQLEALFLVYAHSGESAERDASLRELKPLLLHAHRYSGYTLSENAKRAIKDGHPHPDFVLALSQAVFNEIDLKELDKFEEWRQIASP